MSLTRFVRSDRAARWFVWGCWGGMMLIVLISFARNARNIPIAEDWVMVAALTGNEPDLLQWLWAQNNEHRIPLPKLLLLGVLEVSGGDLRAAMLMSIAMIGAVAAALIGVVRHIRGGRTHLTDAVFPILLLHLGHWENLFWGWQLTQVLPATLSMVLLLVFVRYPDVTRPAAAAAASLALVALPLCGANGLLYVPLPALWLAWRGFELRRGKPSPVERRRGVLLIGVAALALFLCAAYFIGYERPGWALPNPGVVPSLLVALQFLAFGLGPGVQRAWGPAAALSLGVMLVAAVVLVRAVLETRELERRRAIGVTVFAASAAGFAMAMGWGRAGTLDVYGFWPLRYVLMAAPAFCVAYLAIVMYGGQWLRRTVSTLLFATVILLFPLNTLAGWVWRNWYGSEALALERQLSAGASPGTIAATRGEFLAPWWARERLVDGMLMLHEAGIGPFARLAVDASDAPGDSAKAEEQAMDPGAREMIPHTFVYRLRSGGEVWLGWGVDGWRVLADSLRPEGTVIQRRVMRTPMHRTSDGFRAEVRIPAGVRVDYGFLTTHRRDGSEIRPLWDDRPAFSFVARADSTIVVDGAVRLESEISRGIWPWAIGALGVVTAAMIGWRRREWLRSPDP